MANKYRSVLASGGGVQPTGNAQPADVLSGKTFSNADGIDKTGTMVNRGAVSQTISGGQSYTIPAGYHNGSGVVTATRNDPTVNVDFAIQGHSGTTLGTNFTVNRTYVVIVSAGEDFTFQLTGGTILKNNNIIGSSSVGTYIREIVFKANASTITSSPAVNVGSPIEIY